MNYQFTEKEITLESMQNLTVRLAAKRKTRPLMAGLWGDSHS